MPLKSKVVTKRSTLFHGHFSLERLFSFFYLTTISFRDLKILVDDFRSLPHPKRRLVLLKIVEFYHTLYQPKITCARKAMHELLLRIIFETLKDINSTSSIREFVANTFSSRRRDKNHQIRIFKLVAKCRKRENKIEREKEKEEENDCFIKLIL